MDFHRVIMISRIELKGTDFQKIRPIIISKFVVLTLSTFISHSMYQMAAKPIVWEGFGNICIRIGIPGPGQCLIHYSCCFRKTFFTTAYFYFQFQPFELLKTFCRDSNVDNKLTSGKWVRKNMVSHCDIENTIWITPLALTMDQWWDHSKSKKDAKSTAWRLHVGPTEGTATIPIQKRKS